MSTASVVHEQVLQARDLPLKTVTIFTDRAELKRVFELTLHHGLNNIIIDNVCENIEQDSIRVDGKGAAVIHEVQFKTERATSSEVDTPKIKELVKQVQELEEKKADIDSLVKVYTNRLRSVEKVVENVGQISTTNKDADQVFKFNGSVEENLENLYAYHEKTSIALSAKIRSAQKEINDLNQEIEKLNSQLNNLRAVFPIKRSICISLETVVEAVQTEIELTYQAYNASWTPSYDIRVSTIEKKPQLKLIYYGNLHQNTGEDWIDAQLVLSTAKPRMGGQLPTIGTLQAQFKKVSMQPQMLAKRSFAQPSGGSLFGAAPIPQAAMCRTENFLAEPMIDMATQSYQAESHVLSTTFTVPQNKNIPSDGSDHKVTIATLSLQPILHFDAVPTKNTNVYLTASMINSSPYPLLAGDASVYVDNSFSAKIYLKAVASGEKFDCSLGVDPTIKINYKPVHKYQQQIGVLSKTSVSMHEQKIVVKNTKQEEPIILTFIEHVPKSTDEKLKIKLYSPEIKPANGQQQPTTNDELLKLKTPEAGAFLNDLHNLEWTVVLSPLEEKEFVVKWGVEYPPGETVEYLERF